MLLPPVASIRERDRPRPDRGQLALMIHRNVIKPPLGILGERCAAWSEVAGKPPNCWGPPTKFTRWRMHIVGALGWERITLIAGPVVPIGMLVWRKHSGLKRD